jgi:hypothetical protein
MPRATLHLQNYIVRKQLFWYLLFVMSKMLINTFKERDLKRSIKRMRKNKTIRPTIAIDTNANTTHACNDSNIFVVFNKKFNLRINEI